MASLSFPFKARCIRERRTSPLVVGEEVDVIDMAPEDDCLQEMFVIIRWKGREMGVPLGQLESLSPDEGTCEAVADWVYWNDRGYQF